MGTIDLRSGAPAKPLKDHIKAGKLIDARGLGALDQATHGRGRVCAFDAASELRVAPPSQGAILACILYVGARISTVCNLNVSDFHDDRENPVLSVQE